MFLLGDLKTIALAIRKIQPFRKGKKKRIRKIKEKKQRNNVEIIFRQDRKIIKSLLKNVFENIDKQKIDSKQFENMTKLLEML